MKKKPSKKPKNDFIFFAYPSPPKGQNDNNVDAIRRAIKDFNRHQTTLSIKSWEQYQGAASISEDVLRAISKSKVFACDITQFNHNVLFELGFAIGLGKETLILLNESIVGARERYRNSILKGYRYTSFTNRKDVGVSLQQKQHSNEISAVLLSQKISTLSDLLYVKSSVSTEASIELSDHIDDLKNSDHSIMVDDIAESSFKTNEWYARNILSSSIILFDFIGTSIEGADDENSWKSFWAGFATAQNKNVLITAPSKFHAPLDYHEIVIQYRSSEDLIDTAMPIIEGWLTNNATSQEVATKDFDDESLDLLKLAIGEGIAEQEKDKLQYYFIETPEYRAALEKKNVLIVGRKGAGKTAINLRLTEKFASDENNYLITLKPEAHELLEDISISKMFDSMASKRSFFLSLWKLVIFSKLLISIADRLASMSRILTEHEKRILNFSKGNRRLLEMNVYGVMKELNKRNDEELNPKNLEEVYESFLTPLCDLIKEHFKDKSHKYHHVIILADNLDKTWDHNYDIGLQSELILALFEVEGFIQKLISNNGNKSVDIKEVFFLRKDIFDFIRQTHADPDKLTINATEINWDQRKPLLKKMIEKRFQHVLELESEKDSEKVWDKYFDLDSKGVKEPFDEILEVITPRPRDLIVFVSRLFETAFNHSRSRVEQADFDTTLENYSNISNQNLIAEMKAEFPCIENLLADLQRHRGEPISFGAFNSLIRHHQPDDSNQHALIERLFEKGYLLALDHKAQVSITDYNSLRERLALKKWWPFWPATPKISIISHAKSYYIKSKKRSHF